MIRWAIGGTMLLAGLAAVACFGLTRSGPEVVVNAEATPEPAPPVPPQAAEPDLPRVFDVTDIDPLLDPPQAPATGGPAPVLTAVGYEEPAAPTPPAGDVPPIPPAADDEPAAAAPVSTVLARLTLLPPAFELIGDVVQTVPAGLGELPVRVVRTGWYGDEWLHVDGTVSDFWADTLRDPRGFVSPRPGFQIETGYVAGVGLSF